MSNDCYTKPSVSYKSNAELIDQETRQRIGVSALAGKENFTNLTRQHGTSRKFVCAQMDKVSTALNAAFSERENDSDVLFYIPVTKAWLQQVVLMLILACNSSCGGVIEFFNDIFDQYRSECSEEGWADK